MLGLHLLDGTDTRSIQTGFQGFLCPAAPVSDGSGAALRFPLPKSGNVHVETGGTDPA